MREGMRYTNPLGACALGVVLSVYEGHRIGVNVHVHTCVHTGPAPGTALQTAVSCSVPI